MNRLSLGLMVAALATGVCRASVEWDVNAADFPRRAGETDDSPRLQRAIDAAAGKVLGIPRGDYEIAAPLFATNDCSLLMNRSAVLKAVRPMDYVLTIDYSKRWDRKALAAQGRRFHEYTFFTQGGVVDGNGLASCVYYAGAWHYTFRDTAFLNGRKYGLHVGRQGYELIANNLFFKTFLRGLSGNTALFMSTGDSHFTDCIAIDYTIGFHTKYSGSNRFTRCHVWGGPVPPARPGELPEMLKGSIAFLIEDNSTILRDCYADTAETGFVFTHFGEARMFGCQTFNNTFFKLKDMTVIRQTGGGKLLVDGCLFYKMEGDNIKIYEGDGQPVFRNVQYGGFANPLALPGGLPGSRERLFRVGLLTDTHITDDPASCGLVRKAMDLFAREGVDLVCHLGDLADVYAPKGFVHYRQALEEAFPRKAPETFYAFGGHDRNQYRLKPGETNREESVWEIMKKSLKVSHGLYDIREFRGYAFVIIQEYLDPARARKLVAKACADHPGQPVFVLFHEPAWATTDNAVGWGNVAMRKICDDFPQVVHLSGHTHGSNRNEHNIWQGGFTEVNLGCLQNWIGQSGNNPTDRNVKRDDGVMTMDVYGDEIVFHRYSLTTGQEYRPGRSWVVPLPFNAATAPYAPATRRAKSRPPTWLPAAALAVSNVVDGPVAAVRVTSPEARHAEGVYRYTAELLDASGRSLTRVQTLGEFWKVPENTRADQVSFDFDEALFAAAGDYTVRVFPEDFHGNRGEPLKTTVRRDASDGSWSSVWSSATPMADCGIFRHSWGNGRRSLTAGADGWLATDEEMIGFDLPAAAAAPAAKEGVACRLVFTLEDEHEADGSWELRVEDAETGRNIGRHWLYSVQGKPGPITYVLHFTAKGEKPLRVRLGLSYGAPSARLRLTNIRLDARK